MSQFIVIALHDDEDVQGVASDLTEMLGYGGIVREVTVPENPIAINWLKDNFPPAFEDDEENN